MKHVTPWIALAVVLLTACGSKQEATTETTPAATAAPPAVATETASTPTGDEALTAAATSTQESVSEAADSSDDALQRLAPMPENAQLPAGKWKSGVNYKPVVPAQTTSAEPGQVEVLEVFWLGCAHCYALEPYLSTWKKSKPDYVKFVAVPVMWGPAHRSHGRFYYTLEALGKADTLVPKVFDEIHKRGNYLVSNDEAQSQKMQLQWAKANGISEADFTREYNGFAVNTKLQRAEEITRRYEIDGVPRIIINGKYETDVGMAGGQKQLLELINDLSAVEKNR